MIATLSQHSATIQQGNHYVGYRSDSPGLKKTFFFRVDYCFVSQSAADTQAKALFVATSVEHFYDHEEIF